MNNFKVGDNIYHNSFGFGTVKIIDNTSIGVEFDRANVAFNTLYFKNRKYAKQNHGFWCYPSSLKIIPKTSELAKGKGTIVIKQRDNEVTAYMGKKKATAKCSPTDSFDLYKGAILALTRLLLEDKED